MAASLIGISVTVTLQNPPNTIVEGLVANVNPQTSTLTLQNVLFPATGHRIPTYHVEGHAIADIKVNGPSSTPRASQAPQFEQRDYGQNVVGQSQHGRLPSMPQTHAVPQAHQPQHTQPPQPFHHQLGGPAPMSQSSHANHEASNTHPVAHEPFVDPAILSAVKRNVAPAQTLAVAVHPLEAPATPIKPLTAVPTAPVATAANTTAYPEHTKEKPLRKPSAATLEGPFSSLDIADAEDQASDDSKSAKTTLRRTSINKTRTGKPMDEASVRTPVKVKGEEGSKKTRRGGKARKKEVAAQERRNGGELQTPEGGRKGKGNGWRQTPILEDVSEPQARTPGVIGGRVGLEAATASSKKTRRQKVLEAKNGWATEDATDIQELPEFDFAGNLSKFDKRTVFDQIRNEDTTADEDRLVSFNRLARPGTHGGKNLHPTENVLESRRLKSTTNSSTDSDISDFGSTRGSRRAMSRASIKRAPTRQGSGVVDLDAHAHLGSSQTLLTHANRNIINRQYASSSHATGSPKPSRIATPPESPLVETATQGSLRLDSNNRRCHTITPGGMLAVEEIAEVEFGLSEELMAENAARGIAEVALSAINPGGRRLARDNPNARPVIVVLAGNHRGGARAVAAARQLHARGPKVLVALLGFERNADWDRDVRRQVDLLKKFGGSVRAWPDLEDALKRLQAPPELIIDALLGRNKEFDALGDADRRTVLTIVGWANKSRAAVLAVETPSGVGGSTGEVAILEGEPLEVRAKYIVCLGAPRSGLLKALQNGAGRDPSWMIWVVDIGVNRPWRNAGIGGGKGIRFGEDWVVQARFVQEAQA
ncbi:unnamed protein product [Periconia digitata]|uniref:Enhancer of mRNA-decapping protein 3 n=1 Tax=Periconia digitata TaxID=1303443 RepID=A0A9W4XPM3_9PLEO|nr:unnamed protein product [Periconia digitata]